MPPGRRSQSSNKGELYEVKEIIGERVKGGVQEYRVWWKNYPRRDSSWLPHTSIRSKNLIADWQAKAASGSNKPPSDEEELEEDVSVTPARKKPASTASQERRRSTRHVKKEEPDDSEGEPTVAERRASRSKSNKRRVRESDGEDQDEIVETPRSRRQSAQKVVKKEEPEDDDSDGEPTVDKRMARRASRSKTKRMRMDDSSDDDQDDDFVVNAPKTRRQSTKTKKKTGAGGSSDGDSDDTEASHCEIVKILDDRIGSGGMDEYRVRWKESKIKPDSWVKANDMNASELIREYWLASKNLVAKATARVKAQLPRNDGASTASSSRQSRRNSEIKQEVGDGDEGDDNASVEQFSRNSSTRKRKIVDYELSDEEEEELKPTINRAKRNLRSSMSNKKRGKGKESDEEDDYVPEDIKPDISKNKTSRRSSTSRKKSGRKAAASDENDDEYEVEKVLDVDMFEDGVRYKVQWAGYSLTEATWEKSENMFCMELIEKFNKERVALGLPVAATLVQRRHEAEKEREQEKKKREEEELAVKDSGAIVDPKDKDYVPSRQEVAEMLADDAPTPLPRDYRESLSGDGVDGLVIDEEVVGGEGEQVVVDGDDEIVDDNGHQYLAQTEAKEQQKKAVNTNEEGDAPGEEVQQIGNLVENEEEAKAAQPVEPSHINIKVDDFLDAVEQLPQAEQTLEERRRLLLELQDDEGNQLFIDDREEEERHGGEKDAEPQPEPDAFAGTIGDGDDLMDFALFGGGEDLFGNRLPTPDPPAADRVRIPADFEIEVDEEEFQREKERLGVGRDDVVEQPLDLEEGIVIPAPTADELQQAQELLQAQPDNQEPVVTREVWDGRNNNSSFIVHYPGTNKVDMVSSSDAERE